MTDRREQDEREDAAALWFTRWHSQSMTAQQQRELQAWLAASTENRQAFDDMALLWREMSALPRPEITEQAPAQAFPLLRPLRHTLAGLFILVMLFLPYSQLPALLMDNLTLATAAESKSMILPDGSRIFLSRDSEADITYEQTHRRISLVRGTAFFQVKSNPWRPFVIRADGREITVVGTEFDVSRQERKWQSLWQTGLSPCGMRRMKNRCICVPGIKLSAPRRALHCCSAISRRNRPGSGATDRSPSPIPRCVMLLTASHLTATTPSHLPRMRRI